MVFRICLLFLLCPFSLAWSAIGDTKPGTSAIASTHPLATNAGLEILSHGGNAFDAAIAVSAVLAVVEPYHSGMGGGGFWLLHVAKNNTNLFVDGREVAPSRATQNMFLDNAGQSIPELSLNGGLSAAIPGEPAALALIAKRFGRLPLADSLKPAIRLAEEGFPVDHQLLYFLTEDRLRQLRAYPASAAVFLKNNQPFRVGERLVQRDLAKTLRIFASQGRDGFYRGEVARRLVMSVNRAGGIWTLDDLARYQSKIRKPLEGSYHDVHIITAPPPSAGGVGLLIMLQLLAEYPLQSLSPAQRIHYLVEAMRLAFWQRLESLADPDFVPVDLSKQLSPKTIAYLRTFIHKDKATPSEVLPRHDVDQKRSDNTTHFSIIDKEGNRVSATLSINYLFGSSVVAAGTGVLLNDEMDDFAVEATEKNVFGLVGGNLNTIAPGKRPLSSMTPTFLEMPGRVAILGTPGGSRIPSMVLLATLAFEQSYGALSMVSDMRFHHQYLPDMLQFEPDTFSQSVQQELQRMGYQVMPLSQYYGDMQAITWDQQLNLITAASDPRRQGLAVTLGQKYQGYGLMH